MATRYPDEVTLGRSNTKYYNFTSTSFIKREIPTDQRGVGRFGKPIIQRWLAECFVNEAAAIKLIRDRTTIPVPKVLSFGKDEFGLSYLETELVPNSMPCDRAGNQCRMPETHGTHGECQKCKSIAHNNADKFVQNTVLPQLRGLRSDKTGLDGVVIPPGWVLEHDKRGTWPVIRSKKAEFVFCHNDLTSRNIMLDCRTLEVTALIDWELSGFFPPEIQLWNYHQSDQFRNLWANEQLARKHGHLITNRYSLCYPLVPFSVISDGLASCFDRLIFAGLSLMERYVMPNPEMYFLKPGCAWFLVFSIVITQHTFPVCEEDGYDGVNGYYGYGTVAAWLITSATTLLSCELPWLGNSWKSSLVAPQLTGGQSPSSADPFHNAIFDEVPATSVNVAFLATVLYPFAAYVDYCVKAIYDTNRPQQTDATVIAYYATVISALALIAVEIRQLNPVYVQSIRPSRRRILGWLVLLSTSELVISFRSWSYNNVLFIEVFAWNILAPIAWAYTLWTSRPGASCEFSMGAICLMFLRSSQHFTRSGKGVDACTIRLQWTVPRTGTKLSDLDQAAALITAMIGVIYPLRRSVYLCLKHWLTKLRRKRPADGANYGLLGSEANNDDLSDRHDEDRIEPISMVAGASVVQRPRICSV